MSPRDTVRRRIQPGTAPGHAIESVAADVAGAAVHWLRYSSTVFEERTQSGLADALEGVAADTVDWLHFDGVPDATALRWLHERLGLDSLALEDVHNGQQRTKLELYEGHAFMVVSVPLLRNAELSLEQLSLFLGPHWVISFWSGDPALLEPVRQRLRKSVSGRIRKRGADYLFYCLVDVAVDSCFPALEELREQIETLEDQLLEDARDLEVGEIHAIRRKLSSLRRLVLPGLTALQQLLHDEESPLQDTTRRYVRDVLDHQARVGDQVDNLTELSASLHEMHLSAISQRMNDVMRLLTVIATIFIPLTFIAGVYGMNFDPDASPWNMPELRSRFGYPAVLLLFLVVGAGMAWLFRRRDWL
ncbi:magnesium/cobalt transporter CorA [Thioalkalivibrio sp. XN279]|uniref:magnesium/cobalt transporter CorA n=1 Tax=Thioalkalivibrio sp. XN279 TaxID=2714953 RepID=UPI0014081075|nr:magnesium/cobalt transporter CorA [Thioalkalivibrio sp. XN279]